MPPKKTQSVRSRSICCWLAQQIDNTRNNSQTASRELCIKMLLCGTSWCSDPQSVLLDCLMEWEGKLVRGNWEAQDSQVTCTVLGYSNFTECPLHARHYVGGLWSRAHMREWSCLCRWWSQGYMWVDRWQRKAVFCPSQEPNINHGARPGFIISWTWAVPLASYLPLLNLNHMSVHIPLSWKQILNRSFLGFSILGLCVYVFSVYFFL